MLWSNAPDHTGTWMDDATAAIAAGSTHLLLYVSSFNAQLYTRIVLITFSIFFLHFSVNEPDLSSQANMSPPDAAAAWKTYMEPFYGKAILVGPAITNGGPPMGKAWLTEFLQECDGCHVGAVAMHMYDSATNVGYYKNYISDMCTTYNLPVLVTEVSFRPCLLCESE